MTTSLCKGRGSCGRFSVILLLELDSLVASASHDCRHHHHHDSVIITKYFILVLLGRVHKTGLKRVHAPFIKGGLKIRGTPKHVLLYIWSGVAWTYLQLFESNPNPGQYQRTKNLIGLVSVTHCELGKNSPKKPRGRGQRVRFGKIPYLFVYPSL